VRPIYERSEDRRAQGAVIHRFCEAYPCFPVEMPMLCGWDYELHKGGKVVALVEVKCRLCGWRKYPTYMISKRKVQHLVGDAACRDIAPILLVGWVNRLGWVRLDRCTMTESIGGREDRADPMDIEPVLHIPIESFKMVEQRQASP
jgi:hypothetical protein